MEKGKDLGKTSLGMKPNVAAGLSYLLLIVPYVGIIVPIIFYALEKENKFVKFSAMQAIILAVAAYALSLLLIVTIIGPMIVGLAALVLTIILAIKAFNGEKLSLPLLGDWAEKAS